MRRRGRGGEVRRGGGGKEGRRGGGEKRKRGGGEEGRMEGGEEGKRGGGEEGRKRRNQVNYNHILVCHAVGADLVFMGLWERLLITTFPASTLGEQ